MPDKPLLRHPQESHSPHTLTYLREAHRSDIDRSKKLTHCLPRHHLRDPTRPWSQVRPPCESSSSHAPSSHRDTECFRHCASWSSEFRKSTDTPSRDRTTALRSTITRNVLPVVRLMRSHNQPLKHQPR